MTLVSLFYPMFLVATKLYNQGVNVSLIQRGRVVTQGISHQPLNPEVPVRIRFSQCGICIGQNVTGTGFSPSSSVSTVNIFPPWLSTLISPGGRTKGPLLASVQRHILTHPQGCPRYYNINNNTKFTRPSCRHTSSSR
jgi:hypothetical protein